MGGGAQKGRATAAVVVSSFLSLGGTPPFVVFAAAARCVGGRQCAAHNTRALAAESALKGRCWSSTSTSTTQEDDDDDDDDDDDEKESSSSSSSSTVQSRRRHRRWRPRRRRVRASVENERDDETLVRGCFRREPASVRSKARKEKATMNNTNNLGPHQKREFPR